MDFLAEIPKEESGKSKSYDWEQTHLFLYNLASYLIQENMMFCFEVMNDYRNGVLLGNIVAGEENELKISDTEELNDQLPFIMVPEDYDIIDSDSLEEEIARAKESGVEANIVSEMEKKYIGKRFAGDQDTINYLTAIIDLDPLRNLSQDQYIMSCQIEDFITRADQENKNFYALEYKDQKDILTGYVQEWKKENKPAPTLPIQGQVDMGTLTKVTKANLV